MPIPCTRASARRGALGYAPPRQKEKQFFSTELQRGYDEAWRKYVSLNNLHNARDIGGGGEKRENLAEIYIGGSRGEMFLARANSFSSPRPRNFAMSPENVTRLGEKHGECTRVIKPLGEAGFVGRERVNRGGG